MLILKQYVQYVIRALFRYILQRVRVMQEPCFNPLLILIALLNLVQILMFVIICLHSFFTAFIILKFITCLSIAIHNFLKGMLMYALAKSMNTRCVCRLCLNCSLCSYRCMSRTNVLDMHLELLFCFLSSYFVCYPLI